MPASSHQIQTVADEKSDRVVLRNQPETGGGHDPHKACSVAEEVNMEYDRLTDVMHVDMCSPSGGERIDVIDVGDKLGFPGQIIARVNIEERIIYGLTIQNFSAFRRKLFWKYKMASMHRALQLMINVLCAALWLDRNSRTARLHV